MTAGHKHQKIDFLFSSHHSLPHVNGPLVKDILKQVGFEVPFFPKFKIIKGKFDIPYLCGYSQKDGIIYFDRDFDSSSYGESYDEDAFDQYPDSFDCPTDVTLSTHEEIEKKLEDLYHETENKTISTYEQRHHIATHAENLMVDYFGYDWKRYSVWTTRSWHESYAKWKGSTRSLTVPPDLDMNPYEDEHDEILRKMYAAGAPR